MSRLLLRSKKIGDLMGIVTNRPCPACGSSAGGDVIYRNRMLLPESFGLDGSYDIVSCGKCGCCYADITSSEEDYSSYYSNHNIYGGWKANSSSNHDIDVVIRSIEQLVDKDAKIIDIGFGNGELLCKLRDYGYTDLLGIDPAKKSVEELEKKGITCKVGSIYNTKGGQDKKADVVIFTAVLEHLLLPGKAVTAIRDNLLKETGYIVVTWPYFDDLIADDSPFMNNFNHEHINFFSKQTADVLFNRCGFKNIAYHISLGVNVGNVLQFSNIAVYGRSVIAKTIPVVKDERTAISIREYIKRVSSDEQKLLDKIEYVYNSKKEIVIWGVGSYFYHLMKVSLLSKCKISFLVDGNIAKQGSKVFGYEVKAPKELKVFKGVVLVTSMLYGVEIKAEIASMKNGDLEIIENR